jgi:deoxycytidine triphosphate deaminase
MYGTIINNKQILSLSESNLIRIVPFQKNKLQTIHYPLNIKLISKPNKDGDYTEFVLKKNKSYTLAPNEYVIIEIDEHVELGAGIIGEFVPSSNLIEKGLSLTCGKLDPEYGRQGEAIRFGLKNLLDQEVVIEYDLKIAYVRFFDLRALENVPYILSSAEKKLWEQRIKRAMDDGPSYE